jgi:muconate cycloisomerase
MSAERLSRTWKLALLFRLFGFKEVKIKMGFDNDLARLKVVRFLLGPRVDLRLDINGAWEAGEAIEKIKIMRPYRLSMVEQPVAPNDLSGFKKVTEESGLETMADESVRSLSEAETFAKERIGHSVNIRLNKCGGFLNSLKMADLLTRYGLSYQIGCHVGETGILSAAGWHLALCLPKARYLEGGYSRFLLKEDVTKENLTFGWGGKPRRLKGAGLGIEVLEEVIIKYSCKSLIVRN